MDLSDHLSDVVKSLFPFISKSDCSRRSKTPNTKLLQRVYSQIRRHMLRHKHIGPTRWHHKEDDEDVEHDEHEHDEHGDAKRDQTWRH